MKFEMNNHEWEILELPKEQIKLIYEKEMNEETLYVYGLTKYDNPSEEYYNIRDKIKGGKI